MQHVSMKTYKSTGQVNYFIIIETHQHFLVTTATLVNVIIPELYHIK